MAWAIRALAKGLDSHTVSGCRPGITFSIGEFARHGRVSVRMLRHYDAIGLLRPARVDAGSGYRFYDAGQLADLNRVIALKDLGFTLEQVRTVLAEKVSAEELRGMLKLRRAEVHAQIEADAARLARIEARLRTIEAEDRVALDGIVVKRLAPVRVAELTGRAAGYRPDAITPVIQGLYCDLWQRMARRGRCLDRPRPGLLRRTRQRAAAPWWSTRRHQSLWRRGAASVSASSSWARSRVRQLSFTTGRWTTSSPPTNVWPAR